MDKVTRMLFLYQHLLRGEYISKSQYVIEYQITGRSFDRDIQDMRLFLSESFSNLELIYDEEWDRYRLKNLPLKQEIDIGECFILSKLLMDSYLLRTDDQSEILHILLSLLTPSSREQILPVLRRAPEPPVCLDRVSVKLVKDLLFSIERKEKISLQFGKESREIQCAPYSLEVRERRAFLVGWEVASEVPALYPLNDILSYRHIETYPLGYRKEKALQELILMIYQDEFDQYKDYIHQKESD